jgi:hypothetical protein
VQTYIALVELAWICASQAHFTADREAARELWRMALEYQHKATALDNGRPPDVGPPPAGSTKNSLLRRLVERARPADGAAAELTGPRLI